MPDDNSAAERPVILQQPWTGAAGVRLFDLAQGKPKSDSPGGCRYMVSVYARRLPGGSCVEQAQKLEFLFRGEKRRLERVAGQFSQVLVGESESFLGELVFA